MILCLLICYQTPPDIVLLQNRTLLHLLLVDLWAPISVTEISSVLFQTFKWPNCFNMARHFRATCKKLACGDLPSCVIPLESLWCVWNWKRWTSVDYACMSIRVDEKVIENRMEIGNTGMSLTVLGSSNITITNKMPTGY